MKSAEGIDAADSSMTRLVAGAIKTPPSIWTMLQSAALPFSMTIHMSTVIAGDSASPYGTLPPASPPALRKPLSLPRLADMHARGEKITMLTAYDATFAAMADAAGVDMLGINLGKMPKFVRNFMADGGGIAQAMQAYVRAVKDGSFPDDALHAW
jgi:hypothetical protein